MVNITNLESWEMFIYVFMTSYKFNKSEEMEMFAIKNINTPKSLFKYRSCTKNSFKCLEGNYLCSSNPSEFNDPFDSIFLLNSSEIEGHISIYPFYQKKKFFYYFYRKNYLYNINNIHFFNFVNSDIFEECMKSPVSDEEDECFIRQSMFNQMNKSFLNYNFHIQCFSEVKDSVLMWGHYADEHKGFCIEYDTSNLVAEENFYKGLYPVFYSNKLHDLSKALYDYLWKNEVHNIFNFLFVSLVKHHDWKYEKEWRYVEWQDIKKGQKKNVSKLKKLNMGKIKAIYLGMNISKENEHFLMNYAKEKDISVYKMYQSLSDISLNYYEMFY